MIHIIPIEKYKERYSSWWYDYIPKEFEKKRIRCNIINGQTLTDTVDTGTVLDAASTNHYKATQLANIARMFRKGEIKPYDAFLICDIWFPGIEMIPYMSELYSIPVTIWGVWHAGSITHHDFAEPMNPWAKYFEMGWINMCNGVFVGSEYAKEQIVNELAMEVFSGNPKESEELIKKIHPYGMPLNWDELQKIAEEFAGSPKENIILFPHRPDEEKGIKLFFDVIDHLSHIWDDFGDWQFVFCTSKEEHKSQSKLINARMASIKRDYMNVEIKANLNKREYCELLDKTKVLVSTTKEENFGYCVIEGAAFGCHIIAPNKFSHPEIFDQDYRILYDNEDEIAFKIISAANNPIPIIDMKNFVEPYKYVIRTWADIIRGKK